MIRFMTNSITEFRHDRFVDLLKLRGLSDASQPEIVQALRDVSGLTVHQTTISGLIRGTRSPSRKMLGAWAHLLETNTDYLLGLTDDSAPRSDLADQVVVGVKDERQRKRLQELCTLLSQMNDSDVGMLMQMARRLAGTEPSHLRERDRTWELIWQVSGRRGALAAIHEFGYAPDFIIERIAGAAGGAEN